MGIFDLLPLVSRFCAIFSNLGAKKIARSQFQSPVKKKIANCDIGDRQRDP
jgi:hypothetical protein